MCSVSVKSRTVPCANLGSCLRNFTRSPQTTGCGRTARPKIDGCAHFGAAAPRAFFVARFPPCVVKTSQRRVPTPRVTDALTATWPFENTRNT